MITPFEVMNMAALLASCAACASSAATFRTSRLRRELDLVCDWQRFTFDVPPSNASWRGLVRRAEAWHRQDTLADTQKCRRS